MTDTFKNRFMRSRSLIQEAQHLARANKNIVIITTSDKKDSDALREGTFGYTRIVVLEHNNPQTPEIDWENLKFKKDAEMHNVIVMFDPALLELRFNTIIEAYHKYDTKSVTAHRIEVVKWRTKSHDILHRADLVSPTGKRTRCLTDNSARFGNVFSDEAMWEAKLFSDITGFPIVTIDDPSIFETSDLS